MRKAGRWTVGILAAAVVLCAAVLWLYNRRLHVRQARRARVALHVRQPVFPVQVAVFADRVSSYNPRFLGHTENSITLRQIASVKVKAGPVFADVVIDTAGGSPPVVIHGLWKKDAEALAAAIAAAQSTSPYPVRSVEPAAPAPATR